jgi:hypothetical protein
MRVEKCCALLLLWTVLFYSIQFDAMRCDTVMLLLALLLLKLMLLRETNVTYYPTCYSIMRAMNSISFVSLSSIVCIVLYCNQMSTSKVRCKLSSDALDI